MNRILIVAAIALSVGGCAQIQKALTPQANPVSATNLYEGELVFDGAVKTFNELKGLCAARVLPSKCRTYVIQGQSLIGKSYAADKAAQNFVTNNPTLDATNVVQAFINILSDFQATVTALGATKAQ